MIHWIKKAALCVLLLLFLSTIFVSVYCWHLSIRVEKRFSGRKWQIPSTVYSDTTFLYPGKKVNMGWLPEKLKKLGYHETIELPSQKGEYRMFHDRIDIYLKDLNMPGKQQKGFLAAIDFEKNVILEIWNMEEIKKLSLLELGPEVIMQFFGEDRELRNIVSLDTIPDDLINAVIAIEDNRFFDHFGVDPAGILRALFTNIKHGAIRQGGSTLTQQLAKNYFLTHERTFKRKLNELFISIAIELRYSKNEILEIYLNEIYFGQKGSVSVNGVGEAAAFYFGKDVENLTLSESAIIAGMIKGPNLYSPYADMGRCRNRRDQVLNIMRVKGLISTEEAEIVRKEEIQTIGYEKYSKTAPYFLDYVSRQLRELYPDTILSSMGFSIYTTLDTEIQAAAEKVLEKGLLRLEDKIPSLKRTDPEQQLQGAVVVIQPHTGNILAMVGGRDYRVSQFNRITQARRQPGSCFKPIVLASLLDDFKPSDDLSNEETTYHLNGIEWTPENFGDMPASSMSVRDMLKLSCNRAAVDLVVRGGPDRVVKSVTQFNFSTEFQPYPSIVLGAFEVFPIELASAYCVFAADGIQMFPLSLKDVVDEQDNLLVRRHMDINSVISPAKAFLITSMLETVVNDGTARSLKHMGIDFCAAGKTGTTNDFRDAWFIGYMPDFLALVWVGFDNGESILSTGSGAALPIWADLVRSIPGSLSQNRFTMPPGVVKKRICSESRELAVTRCTNNYEEYFLEENAQKTKCHIHSTAGTIKRFFNGIKNLFQ